MSGPNKGHTAPGIIKQWPFVRDLGADRVLFGSDYSLFELNYCLGMIEDANIAREEKELILHGNAERLFGISLTAPH